MNKLEKNCKVCGKRGEFKCNKCGKVVYCSRECQFKDWPSHKKGCTSSSNLNKNINSSISPNKRVRFNKKVEINNIKNNKNLDEHNLNDNISHKSKRSRNISSDFNNNKKGKNDKNKNSSLNPISDINKNTKNKNITSIPTNDTASINTNNTIHIFICIFNTITFIRCTKTDIIIY